MVSEAKKNRAIEKRKPAPGMDSLQIMLAYDGSRHAQAAVNLLRDLPLPPESIVNVLAVLPTQYISGHEALQAALDHTQALLEEGGIQVSTELKAGNPAASINETVREYQNDLTLIGAKGLRSTLGILLGGVAQQVVEYSCCPVLVVRAPYEGLERVLVVIDGSVHSQRALEYLAPPPAKDGEPTIRRPRLPLPQGTDVRVMHVLPPSIPPDIISRTWAIGPDMVFTVPPQSLDVEALEAQEDVKGKALLAEAVRTLEAGGIQAISKLARGDAATEIIEYVQESRIDLIVCGSRGLSQVTSWLLGSVSRKLVHYAGCSVLIVKPGDQEPT